MVSMEGHLQPGRELNKEGFQKQLATCCRALPDASPSVGRSARSEAEKLGHSIRVAYSYLLGITSSAIIAASRSPLSITCGFTRIIAPGQEDDCSNESDVNVNNTHPTNHNTTCIKLVFSGLSTPYFTRVSHDKRTGRFSVSRMSDGALHLTCIRFEFYAGGLLPFCQNNGVYDSLYTRLQKALGDIRHVILSPADPSSEKMGETMGEGGDIVLAYVKHSELPTHPTAQSGDVEKTASTNATDTDQPSFLAMAPAKHRWSHADPITDGVEHPNPS
ncbi:hypothetical protein T265_02870 [Opisthorchis viverrini]|uniref:Talin 1-like rod-segment domain-containing protein n=1 Tax=Opisthorchis viverrini TaxID=6198 RepID=A0A075AHZ0_OPIVI|nr:hypothetical protein T265_02870 [Opisthorchis viverrini]KER30719.1 hypothetical protein T265_02870 [Opisthorchis viverrini]